MQRESVYQSDNQDTIAICVRFPRAMYDRIKVDAARDNRSYGRQVVHLCTQAFQGEQERSPRRLKSPGGTQS